MKHLKVLGLAVVAIAALTAIFGAGPASATQTVQICTTVAKGTGDGKCTTKEDEAEIPANEEIVAHSTNPVLTSSITNVTCENSSTTVVPNASTGTDSITGTVQALSFSGNCKTSSGTACTVQVVNLPYEGHLYTEKLQVTDAVGAGAKVVCGFLINCTFTTKSVDLTVTHEGDNTVFHAKGVKLERSGGFCPETSEWHATYTATKITVT